MINRIKKRIIFGFLLVLVIWNLPLILRILFELKTFLKTSSKFRIAQQILKEYNSSAKTTYNTSQLVLEQLDEEVAKQEDLPPFVKRAHSIEIKCEKYKWAFNSPDRPWLLVSNSHNLIYCQIPKAGCSNWMKILAILNKLITPEEWEQVDIHRLKLPILPPYLRNHAYKLMMENFIKFTLVREPFSRLLSCYRDKFEPKAADGNLIAFQGLAEMIAVDIFPPSFSQFVHFIVNLDESVDRGIEFSIRHRHWLPQTRLCDFCATPHDAVLKIESINDESEEFSRWLGISEDISYPKEESKLNKESILKTYYSKLEPNLIRALYDYYKMDFLILDYSVPEFLSDVIFNEVDVD